MIHLLHDFVRAVSVLFQRGVELFAWIIFVTCIVNTTSLAISCGIWNKPFSISRAVILGVGWFFWWRYK